VLGCERKKSNKLTIGEIQNDPFIGQRVTDRLDEGDALAATDMPDLKFGTRVSNVMGAI
jgi:hypothetical protein